MSRIAALVLGHPKSIIAVFLAVCAVSVVVQERYGVYDFRISTMAPRDSVEWERYEEFRDLFGDADEMFFLLAFRDESVVTNDHLDMLDRITERIDALEDTGSTTSLSDVLDMRGTEDGLVIEEFAGPLPLSDEELRVLLRRFQADPLVAGQLLSADGTTAAIVGRLHTYYSDAETRLRYFMEVASILEEESGGRLAFHPAGIPYMDSVLVGHMLRDTSVLIPLTFLVYAALFFLSFRRLRATWMPVIPIGVAAAVTLGALTGVGKPMTMLTGQGVLTTLLMVIGLSDAVHVLNRFEEDIASDPAGDRPSAIARTIRHIGFACLLTSATTAIGFISLSFTDVPTIRDFGIFGALGIGLAYLAAILFMPSLICLLERFKRSEPRTKAGGDLLARMLARVAEFVIAHPRPILISGVLVLAVSIVSATAVRIDQRFSEDLRDDEPAVLAQNFIKEHLGGVYPLEILVKGEGPDAVKDPSVLAAMEALQRDLEALPHVSKVVSPVGFIKKMNRAMNENREEAYAIPSSKEAVAQYLLLFEMAGGDNEFDRLVNYDYSVARITAIIADLDAERFGVLLGTVEELLEDRFPPGIQAYPSGGQPLFYAVSVRLVWTLMRSLYLAMPVIFVVISLVFRSGRIGLISAVPNVIPLTVGLGFLGLSGISLRFVTIIAFPVAFGIAIDDTIHFLARYREERSRGLGMEDAIRRTFATAGRAMFLTTFFLVVGFGLLAFSEFKATIDIGIAINVIVVSALYGDFLILPALLLVFRPAIPELAAETVEAGPVPDRDRVGVVEASTVASQPDPKPG